MEPFNAILLDQRRLVSQQLGLLSEQLYVMQMKAIKPQQLNCEFCGEEHDNGCCEANTMFMTAEEGDYCTKNFIWEQQSHPQNQSEESQDRLSNIENALTQFIRASQTNFENTQVSIRILEVQVGRLSEQIVKLPYVMQRNLELAIGQEKNVGEVVDQEEEIIVEIRNGYGSIEEVEEKQKECGLEEEIVENKNKNEEGELRLGHEKLQVITTTKAQLLVDAEKLPSYFMFSWLQLGKILISNNSAAGALGHLLLYAKFMEVLVKRRKRKNDIFFLSYQPP